MSAYKDYAKWGWATFPVAGPVYAEIPLDYKTWKSPLLNWKCYQERLPSSQEISVWEKKWPLAWVGGTTGPLSGIFVIDIDGEKGKESLKSLNINMPVTRIASTKRGFHYFFKWSKRMENLVTSKNGVFPGIDIKGKGGFVILPSFHSKRSWSCEAPLAELPEAWYSHLTKSESLPKDWQAKAIADLSEGNRHDTFVRLISSCFNAGWAIESIKAVLLPLAEQYKLDEKLDTLIIDVKSRYFTNKEEDIEKKRFLDMQENTRSLIYALREKELTTTKLELLDLYDEAAVRWVKETGPWEDSQAAYLALQLKS